MDIQGNEQWSHDQGSVCACMIECDFEVRLCATWMSDIINLSGFKEYYSVPTRRVKLGLCRRTDNLCSQSSKNIYLKGETSCHQNNDTFNKVQNILHVRQVCVSGKWCIF